MTMTNIFIGLVQKVRSHWIAPEEVRRESFALGGRHRGEVGVGARKEMAEPGTPFRRAILLRAVIRDDARAKASRSRSALSKPKRPEA